jgi:transcriptional regulator with XRE-family HTH domain
VKRTDHWNHPEFLRRLRRRGLRQDDFARASGIHPSTLSLYASGKRVPNNLMVRRISEALHAIPELPEVARLVGMR